ASVVDGLQSRAHPARRASDASAGQAVFVPSQASATSQSLAAARHSVPALPAACWQVVLVPSQVSVVHGLPSSVHAVPLGCVASAGQAAFVPSQTSATSQSPAAGRHSVPAFPAGPPWLSLQSSSVPGWQPATGSQVSRPSQGFPLSHTSGVPFWQAPVLVSQVSVPVQTSPSSQSASVVQQPAIGAFTQPPALLLAAGSQLSAVHTIPSSQVGGVPSTHVPSCGLQVSRPLQKRPSSQVTAGVWLQTCWTVSQASVVQRSWSSQSASTLQQPATGGKLHKPVAWSHVSVVQTSPSLQTTGVPAWHV